MLLQFCDQCGRPLSEGAIARGDAVERDGELICTQCLSRQPIAPRETDKGPLGDYHDAVWHCEGCGIPVNALDLIEGRATRVGGVLRCSRCNAPARPASQAPTVARTASQVSRPAPKPVPRATVPRAAPLAAAQSQPTRHASTRAEEFVTGAERERRRPVLPIVLFVIVLSMFAVSLWFALSSQQRLNEVMAERGNTQPDEPRRPAPERTPRETPSADTPERDEPDTPPLPPPDPTRIKPIPEDIARELVGIEKELAAPVILKLQSDNLGEVWEGLIEAGARRLIATRPYVRALLRDPHDNTRLLACRVTAMLDDTDALVELSRMAEQDPDEAVRIEAGKARDRLTGRSTREVRDMTPEEIRKLIKDLQDELERRGGSDG